MAEPEGLVIDAARWATSAIRDLWMRDVLADHPAVTLAQVRPRLECFLVALWGEEYALLPSDTPPPPTWLARLTGHVPRHLALREPLAHTDGVRLWLPRALAIGDGPSSAVAVYRLLAMGLVARILRGTPRLLPGRRPDAVERDLYLLAEAIAVDRWLGEALPGVIPDLLAARAAALAARPPLDGLTPRERSVEGMVCAALSFDPRMDLPAVPFAATPSASRQWAERAAAELRALNGRYRGIRAVPHWGQVIDAIDVAPAQGDALPERNLARVRRSATLRKRPRRRPASREDMDERPGTWMIKPDDPMESVEDPMGLQRPADTDDTTDPRDLADALADLPEAPTIQSPEVPPEVLDSETAIGTLRATPTSAPAAGTGLAYPEWNHRAGGYRMPGAIVWPEVAPAGSTDWGGEMLDRHRALVREVRRRFESLRSRRMRLGRQADGTDLDIDAYVMAFAERRAGHSMSNRLYTAERRGRRELAAMILIDTSASTDSWVSGRSRIIDVEKEALIVLLEALDALGDAHAVLGFSSRGPAHVHLLTIKAFDESAGNVVRSRVAGLEPDGYTRVGAALRHASAVLARQPARHRLLLLLSDGKPNDLDQYEGRYGVEDTRQAVAEGRLQGLVTFCLTVDRAAPAYLPAIFGRDGYTVLQRPEHLPVLLVDAVRRLLAASS